MPDRWKKTIRGLYSAFIFSLVVSFIFQSWEIALVITTSLAFHEFGHILVVYLMGIDWEFGFSFLGAWTKTPLISRQRIGHYANSLIHLAGPFFSFLLSVLALVIYFLLAPQYRSFFWPRLANFSVLLAVTNILPMGSLSDGGKFIKRVFISLPKQSRWKLLIHFLPIFVSSIEHFTDFNDARAVSFLIFLLWFATSMILESRQAEPGEAELSKPLTEHQSSLLLSGVTMLVLFCFLITTLTPFWLTQGDVLHVLYSFEAAVLYLILDSPPALKAGLLILVIVLIGLIIWVAASRAYKTISRRNVSGAN